MDVDLPVYTHIWWASTEEDKKCLQEKGACFYCEQQGHMAWDCPRKIQQQMPSENRQQPSRYGQGPYSPCATPPLFKKGAFNQPKINQGFRKTNKLRKPSYTPHACVAQIEEVEEEIEKDKDNNVMDLAYQMTRLSLGQHEQWVQEINETEIHF